jgi:hypothetical protein
MSLSINIVENNNSLVAQVIISDPDFDEDLALVKSVPYEDRKWRFESKQWLIYHAERYTKLIPELKRAVDMHKKQMRFL